VFDYIEIIVRQTRKASKIRNSGNTMGGERGNRETGKHEYVLIQYVL